MMSVQTNFKGCKISGDATFNTAGRNINIDQRRNVHNVTESQTNNFQGATIRNSTAGVMGNAGHPPAAPGPGAPAEQQQNSMGTETPPRSPLPQTAQQTAANGAPSVETNFDDCEFQGSPEFNAARQDININRQTQEHNSRQEQVNNMQGATIEDSTVAVMGDVNAGNSPVAPGQGRRQTGGASSNNASRSVSRRQELNADNAVITGSIVGVMGNVTMTNGSQHIGDSYKGSKYDLRGSKVNTSVVGDHANVQQERAAGSGQPARSDAQQQQPQQQQRQQGRQKAAKRDAASAARNNESATKRSRQNDPDTSAGTGHQHVGDSYGGAKYDLGNATVDDTVIGDHATVTLQRVASPQRRQESESEANDQGDRADGDNAEPTTNTIEEETKTETTAPSGDGGENVDIRMFQTAREVKRDG